MINPNREATESTASLFVKKCHGSFQLKPDPFPREMKANGTLASNRIHANVLSYLDMTSCSQACWSLTLKKADKIHVPSTNFLNDTVLQSAVNF